jgi:hypothetical protein
MSPYITCWQGSNKDIDHLVRCFSQISSRVAHDQWNSLVNTLVTSVIADQSQADSLKDSELNDLARRLTAVRHHTPLLRCLSFSWSDTVASTFECRVSLPCFENPVVFLGPACFVASFHRVCPTESRHQWNVGAKFEAPFERLSKTSKNQTRKTKWT